MSQNCHTSVTDCDTSPIDALYAELKTIYARANFDAPAMVARRRELNQAVYRAKYSAVDGEDQAA